MSVGDYCKGLNDGTIIVNDEYQRNAGVWASQARSFFIESILLEYPIPKIFLYARVDLATRQTVKEIVDGQQRSHALQNFYNRKYRLSSKLETEELRGRNYNQLSEEMQSTFLSYSLPIDEFRAVQPIEIQESFRRMNSSNVPLNDEEQRNARFQGPFKWFIESLCHEHAEPLRVVGLLSRRDIIRMADTKIFSEIIHTILNGFVTTKGPQLDALYRQFNTTFDQADLVREYINFCVNEFLQNADWHQRELLRGYMFQSLALVLIDRQFQIGLQDRAAALAPDVAAIVANGGYDLGLLLEAIRDPENAPQLETFVASTKGTNVARAKAVRFLYLAAVL
jgi:hypothetical protein